MTKSVVIKKIHGFFPKCKSNFSGKYAVPWCDPLACSSYLDPLYAEGRMESKNWNNISCKKCLSDIKFMKSFPKGTKDKTIKEAYCLRLNTRQKNSIMRIVKKTYAEIAHD